MTQRMNVLIVVCAQGILNAHSNEISAFEALGREANRLIANWRSIVCHRKKASVPSAKRPKHDGAPSAPNLLPLRKLECAAEVQNVLEKYTLDQLNVLEKYTLDQLNVYVIDKYEAVFIISEQFESVLEMVGFAAAEGCEAAALQALTIQVYSETTTWRVIVTDASTVHASTLALSGWLQPSAFSCRKSNLWEAAAGKTKLAMLEIRELKSATCRRSGAAFFIDNRVAYVHSSCSNDLLTLWPGGRMAKMIDCGTKPSAAKQQEEHERQEAAEQDRLYTATNLAAASAVWFASVNFNSCFVAHLAFAQDVQALHTHGMELTLENTEVRHPLTSPHPQPTPCSIGRRQCTNTSACSSASAARACSSRRHPTRSRMVGLSRPHPSTC